MNIEVPFIEDSEVLDSLLSNVEGNLKYPITNDFLSRYVLQNDLYALKGLLAALLHVDLDDITGIKIMNPIEPSTVIYGKDCILDIKLELNNVKIINIEIQSVFQEFWAERSITYLCRIFDNVARGFNYSTTMPCVHIGIMNCELFRKDDPRYCDDFYSEYRLLNTRTHTEYSSKFEIRVLSLNHIDNATDQDKCNPNGLYYWAKLFKATTWGDLMELVKENPRIKSFVGTVVKLTEEEQVVQACERRELYLKDIASFEQNIADRDLLLTEKELLLAEKEKVLAEKDEALAEKDEALAKKDEALAEKDEALAERDEALAKKDEALAEKDEALAERDEALAKKDEALAEKDEALAEG